MFFTWKRWFAQSKENARKPRRRPNFIPQVEQLETRMAPATLVVSNLNDSGSGSLRAEILAASAGDTVNFGLSGTIKLTTGAIAINQSITIDGTGATIAVSGNGFSSVFVLHNSGPTVTINNLLIENGSPSGGTNGGDISVGTSLTNGNLTLTNDTIETGSTAAGKGGGIFIGSKGNVTLSNSTVANNTASTGGGIYDNGTLTINNSTIAYNNATNTTTGNGGGINAASTAPKIFDTIISNNSVAGTSVGPDFSGTVSDQGFNLVSNTGGSTGFTAATDILGKSANLATTTPQNNGGPTPTFAESSTSPSLGKGSTTAPPGFTLPSTDQRGYPRIVNNTIDIGSFQAQGTTVGVYDPNNAVFHLSNLLNNPGAADYAFFYGNNTPAGWTPVVGNYAGTGQDTPGVFDPANAIFHLSTTIPAQGGHALDTYAFHYPNSAGGWIPIAGNFFGTSTDTVGVFDPNNAVFHLANTLNNPTGDTQAFQYGQPAAGWIPVAGDFFGLGKATVGLFDPHNAVFHLRNPNTGADLAFFYGHAGWTPYAGTFTGTSQAFVGLFDPTNGIFHGLKSLPAQGSTATDAFAFQYGGANWAPVAGNWGPNLPQLAAGGEAAVPSGAAPLTNGQLQTEVQAALNLLAADGVNKSLLAQLGSLHFTVGQLPAGYLGLSNLATGQVELSADAAGYGWFVDANPLLDQAFINGVAQPGSAAANRMDLLTVVLHEMGHFDGWTELDPATHPDALMALTLGTGQRRIDALDAVFAAGL